MYPEGGKVKYTFQKQRHGQFVISLDLELNWGMFDINKGKYNENVLGVRKALPKIVSLFKKYEIHATWAIVGLLFCENKNEVQLKLEYIQPTYVKLQYNPLYHIKNIGENEDDDPLHFGKTLIDEIKKDPFQEISTHTFSHYYCLEEGQTKFQFKRDLLISKGIHEKNKLKMKSIVFPRIQINYNYLDICKEMGIVCYRGNRNHFIYKERRFSNQIILKALRWIDCYVNISGYHLSSIDISQDETIVNIPESMFLRPYSSKLYFLEKLKERRIKKSMLKAAKESKRFHLWWNPHHFGKNIEENLAMLERILLYYQYLKKKYNFQSYSMAEIVEPDFFNSQ